MIQELPVHFDLLIDRFLDDGRLVVINSSADGRFGPDHSALVLQGALDVPLGVEFTMLVGRRSRRQGNEYFEEQVGNVEQLALRIVEIEFYRKLVSAIPCGHNAAVRFEGDGIELVHNRIVSKQKNFHYHLVTNDFEA